MERSKVNLWYGMYFHVFGRLAGSLFAQTTSRAARDTLRIVITVSLLASLQELPTFVQERLAHNIKRNMTLTRLCSRISRVHMNEKPTPLVSAYNNEMSVLQR